MTDFMFSNPPEKPPKPDEIPFDDVKQVQNTAVWESLVESCEKVANDLERYGELSSNDVSSRAKSPRIVKTDEEYKRWVWTTVCPTLESHPNIRWNDCWKFDPEKGLSESEWKEIASGFNIRVRDDDDPRQHYPRVIKGIRTYLKNVYSEDNARHGVSGYELIRNVFQVSDEAFQDCVNYAVQFDDIVPPSSVDDRPDWEWVDEPTENDH